MRPPGSAARAEVYRPLVIRGGWTLPRQGIDSFWVSTWRERARGALNDLGRSKWRAEVAFEDAARSMAEGDAWGVNHSLEMAFRWIEHARWDLREARRCARAALTGCIDSDPPARRLTSMVHAEIRPEQETDG